jgi:hypothetical protein
VVAGYFGGMAVAVGNAARLRKDSILTLVSQLFLILFIQLVFKRKVLPTHFIASNIGRFIFA